MIPQVVQDYVDGEGVGGSIRQLDSKNLSLAEYICIPGHSHDLGESNIGLHLVNLTKVGLVSLMGAPNCTFYKKTDPDEPAYVVADWNPTGMCQEYWWAEF